MIRFKNVVVLLSSLVVLAPLVSAESGCASKKSSSSSSKQKGGGAKGTAAAAAKQTPGGTASGAASTGENKGADLEGATCDASTEGVAWCDNDTTVVLCTGGTWYAVDCSAIGADVCATDIDSLVVDCYSVDDVN